MKYIVIARIGGKDYMVNAEAESLGGAEHKVLDMGICGRHENAVEGAQAFGTKEMKTDCFIGMAMKAETISMNELYRIVAERNEEIRIKDEAEDKIREIEKQMKKLSEELEAAKKILEK